MRRNMTFLGEVAVRRADPGITLHSTHQAKTTMMRALLILAFLLLLCGAASADGYCNGIQSGGIMISGFNMDDPDQVLMVTLEMIEEGAVFYMTDRPWNGTEFLDVENDGTLKWQVNGSLPRNAELCHRCTQDGSVIDRFEPVMTGNSNYTFSLDSAGDAIFLYCMMEPDSNNGTGGIRHISAITNTGVWIKNATNADGSESVLPSGLLAVTTLDGFPNFEYDGPMVGTKSFVTAGLIDAQYWDGQEEWIANLQTKATFKIVDDPDSGASSNKYLHVGGILAPFLCTIFVY